MLKNLMLAAAVAATPMIFPAQADAFGHRRSQCHSQHTAYQAPITTRNYSANYGNHTNTYQPRYSSGYRSVSPYQNYGSYGQNFGNFGQNYGRYGSGYRGGLNIGVGTGGFGYPGFGYGVGNRGFGYGTGLGLGTGFGIR